MSSETKKSVRFYEDEIDALLDLEDDGLARIVRSILCECLDREQPELKGAEKALYKTVLGQVRRDRELSATRKESGTRGGKAKATENQTETNSSQIQTNDEQNQANDKQIQANGEQIQANVEQIQAKDKQNQANESTNTITNTNTNTNTFTNTLLPAADAAEGGGFEKAPKNSSTSAYEESFERFWSCYPRKTAKQSALKAWLKLKPDEALVNEILSSLEKFKKTEQWLRDDRRYIPYPATWLGDRRWEDEVCSPPQNNTDNSDKPQKRSSGIDTAIVMERIRARYNRPVDSGGDP